MLVCQAEPSLTKLVLCFSVSPGVSVVENTARKHSLQKHRDFTDTLRVESRSLPYKLLSAAHLSLLMFDVEGFILVGGLSRRMGRDKALLDFGGQSLLERISGELSAFSSEVSLVGARQIYSSFKNVADIHHQWGALGGIHAALAATKKDWAAVVACDLPFVTRELLERLGTFVNQMTDAVVPIQPDGRPQPVCALYRTSRCLPEIEKLIAAGEHTPRVLLASVQTRFVDFVEIQDLPGADKFFFNVNTPGDLKNAQAMASQ